MTDPDPDPIEQVARLRELGATVIKMERTRGGTWRIEAVWAQEAHYSRSYDRARAADSAAEKLGAASPPNLLILPRKPLKK